MSLSQRLSALFCALAMLAAWAPHAGAGADGGTTLEFQGPSVSIPPAIQMVPQGTFTIEAWVRPTTVAGIRPIYATNACGSNTAFIFRINGGNLQICYGTTTVTAPAGVVAGEWQHVAATFEGTFVRFFRNGRFSSLQLLNGPPPLFNAAGQFLGTDGTADFLGEMDEFRLWNVDFTQVEIQDRMHQSLTGSEAGLVAHYKFDEGSGTVANDNAPFAGNNLALVAAPMPWPASTAPISVPSVHANEVTAIWDSEPDTGDDSFGTGLDIADVSFLNDQGDDIVFGHDGGNLEFVALDEPTVLASRVDRLWQAVPTDVSGNGGTVRFTFGWGAPSRPLDPTKLYYLLRRAVGTSDAFTIFGTASSDGAGAEVSFDVDLADIGAGFEFSLGEMRSSTIGLYWDAAYTQTVLDDAPLSTPIDAWVVIRGVPTVAGEGLQGWEAFVDLPPEMSVLSATLVPGGSINTGDPGDQEWIVDTVSCEQPDGNGDTLVLQYSLSLDARPSGEVTFSITGTTPSSFSPSAPGWFDCDGNRAFFTGIDAAKLKFSSPGIASVVDVPDDQGGWVRVTVDRSSLDDVSEPGAPLTGYNLWREVVSAKLAEDVDAQGVDLADLGSAVSAVSPADGRDLPDDLVDVAQLARWGAKAWQGRVFLEGGFGKGLNTIPPGTWEIVASFFALQQTQYVVAAPTVADDPVTTSFFVTAHTKTATVWYGSQPASGASIDNIAPGVPQGITAGYEATGVDLSWDSAPEADFQYYRVYRDTHPGFVPSPGNLVQEIAVPAWQDPTGNPWGFVYKITALDHAGNESLAGSPTTVTGTGDTPGRFALADAVPNPFNPSTVLSFDLPREGVVRLAVFDVAGRLVTTLLDEPRTAGRHEVRWDGRNRLGRTVAAGVYLYRIEADGFTATKRMTLVK